MCQPKRHIPKRQIPGRFPGCGTPLSRAAFLVWRQETIEGSKTVLAVKRGGCSSREKCDLWSFAD
jgi:hypothetical protein